MTIYHTKTQEDYNELMFELERNGFCWRYDETSKTGTNFWNEHKSKTCLRVDEDALKINYCSIDLYELQGYDINEYKSTPFLTNVYSEPLESIDNVNHPSHYQNGGIETIDIIKALLTEEQFKGYLLGNVIKYRERATYKGNKEEDYKKAKWYFDKSKGDKE